MTTDTGTDDHLVALATADIREHLGRIARLRKQLAQLLDLDQGDIIATSSQHGALSYMVGQLGYDQRYGFHKIWFDAEHGWFYCSDSAADPATGACAYRLGTIEMSDDDAIEAAASQVQTTHRHRDLTGPACRVINDQASGARHA